MKQSQLFAKTLKNPPNDEFSQGARLLTQAGFIQKLSSGIYSFLPLGFLVLKKIENIIREEMNAVGGQELLMPALHPKEIWEESNRWSAADYLYKLKDRQKKEYVLGATHEEIIVDIARKRIFSYRDLPLALYQIQTKFRDELRAKSGLLRTKEFSMKDLYSFHADEKDFRKYYEKVKEAYFKIFTRCGFKDIIVAEAAGGIFTKEYTHEFQIPTEAGEDNIVFCPKGDYAKNREIFDKTKGDKCPVCGARLEEKRAIEAGNIFPLGTRFSEPMRLNFIDKNGEKKLVIMGCYGIGLGRGLGAAAEIHHDENGVIWPEEIAPFKIHLVLLDGESGGKRIKDMADKFYQDLRGRGIEALYDEREGKTAGEKFADADLIGIPYRIIASEKTIKQDCVEIKRRNEKKAKLIKIKDFKKRFEI